MKQQFQFNIAVTPVQRAREMLRADKAADAVALMRAYLQAHADDHAAWHLLSVAEVQPSRKRYYDALKAIRQALKLAPEIASYQTQLGFALMHAGRYPEAIAQLQPLLEAQPEDYALLNALHMAYLRSGDNANALALGQRIMTLEDRTAMQNRQPPPPARMAPRPRGQRKIIAYALWGGATIYNHGALVNARIAPFFYPGWQCRFYLGSDVPRATVDLLTRTGAEVIDASACYPDIPPSMWRFLPADDAEVGLFVSRDCDSRPSAKEAAAVAAWLASGKRAHVMHDHITHRVVMLAGLWGARTDPALHMAARIRRLLAQGPAAGYGGDQLFLMREIWPEICDDCLLHDSYYNLFGAVPFPLMGRGDDKFHVGIAVSKPQRLQEEARLLGLPVPVVG